MTRLDLRPLPGVPRFLTVKEVAARMRVSKMTVYRLMKDGELDNVRVGKTFRVPETSVIEYMGSTKCVKRGCLHRVGGGFLYCIDHRCQGIRSDGNPCENPADGYCRYHKDQV